MKYDTTNWEFIRNAWAVILFPSRIVSLWISLALAPCSLHFSKKLTLFSFNSHSFFSFSPLLYIVQRPTKLYTILFPFLSSIQLQFPYTLSTKQTTENDFVHLFLVINILYNIIFIIINHHLVILSCVLLKQKGYVCYRRIFSYSI